MNTRNTTNEPIYGVHTDLAVDEMINRGYVFASARGVAHFEHNAIRLRNGNAAARVLPVEEFKRRYKSIGWRKLAASVAQA